jgi:hypothetical protein
MKMIRAITLGIKRHPLRFFGGIFLAYSALWTVVESLSHFLPQFKLQGAKDYFELIAAAVLIALGRIYQPREIEFQVKHCNTKVRLVFGNIFSAGGYIAIPVNEFFDSELGSAVSAKSLHGMVISDHFGGHTVGFDQSVAKDLTELPTQQVFRPFGKQQKYPIGTTAHVKTNSRNFLLFALSRTDISTFKASADIADLVRSLEGLCAKARNVLGGEKLVLPLVGGGLSGIGLPSDNLLQIILTVIVNETKKQQVAEEIYIVLHPSRFDEIELELIKRQWS